MPTVRWLSGAPAPPGPARHTPAHSVLYAIGDIHGRLDLLDTLLDAIEAHAGPHPGAPVQVIFLGDYLSRGENSRGVVERVLRWRASRVEPWRVVTLKGNHEDLALRFLAGDLDAARHWFDYDGLDALRDYGVTLPDPDRASPARADPGAASNRMHADGTPSRCSFDDATLLALRQAFADALPASHRAFLEELAVSHRAQDYYFVHAGVRPGVALQAQTAVDQMWIRKRFLESDADHGAMVVHGHTIAAQPQVRANRIGIDTGASSSGVLTCLVLRGQQRSFLQAIGPGRPQPAVP